MPVYKQVLLNVRPPRLAIAFPGGSGWETPAQRLLEGFSRIWGGAGNVIFSVGEDGEVHPAVWRVLKRYDADRWGYYAPTLCGRQMANPEAFDAWLDREASTWAEKNGGTVVAARELLTADHLLHDPLCGPPDARADRILREMAPDARSKEQVFDVVFMADADPGPHVGPARTAGVDRLRLPAIGDLPVPLQLLIRGRTGDLAPTHRDELVQAGVEIEDTPVDGAHLSTLLAMAWVGHGDDSHELQRAVMSRLTGEKQEVPAIANDRYLSETPLANSVAGCGLYHVWHPDWDERPFVVVAGGSAEDFALALALDRCYSTAAWLPTTLDDDHAGLARDALARVLYDAARPPRKRRLLLTSTSLAETELTAVVAALNAEVWGRNLSLEVVDSSSIPLLPPQRLFEHHRFGREEHLVPFVDDVLAGHLPPVIPAGPETPPPESLTWQIDVHIEGFNPPPRWCLNQAIQDAPALPEAMRAGSDGPSYRSTRMGLVMAGSIPEQRVTRPRLRLPTASEMVELLAKAAGLTAKPSATGKFTRGMTEIFGGLDDCASALREPTSDALLNGYQSAASSDEAPGVYLESISRRFLTLTDVATLAGVSAEQARTTVDQLLERQVLNRGLLLSCERCSHAAFYPLAQVSQTFTCSRCGATASIVQQRWKKPVAEPHWYYALDEVVFQALHLDGWDVVQALAKLRQQARSFLWTPQTEFYEGEHRRGELDILAIADGRVIVGEAKKGDRLGDTARAERQAAARLLGLAEALTADTLVLASRTTWSQRTRDVIAEAVGSKDIETRLLETIGT